jgi:uncharacterized protein (TIGR00299 family) protein
MRIAYLDCFSGVSGDMFLGAVLDVGVSTQLLEETVAALNIGARLEVSHVNRGGISATKVDVYAHGEKDLPREVYWEQRNRESQHGHPHGKHEHHESHHTHHEHPHQQHNHSHDPSRGLKEIRQIIGQSTISAGAKKIAIRIFEALGKAEARIHNTDIENVHFHEVGAVDAMVDIVCAAVGFETLKVDALIVSPLNVGGGTVQCAHGVLPVPAPATLELLRGSPIYSTDIQAELVTPTGAAIVSTLATRFAAFPALRVEKIGYGAGTRDFPGQPNVVRLSIGEAQSEVSADRAQETITVLETNLDDSNPQVFAYVMDRLFEQGALDAFGIPIYMKKNRPGMLLTVLCRHEDAAKLTRLIFTETTTLGVRQRQEKRAVLERAWIDVATQWGNVRMKVARLDGAITNYAPEYEDCKRIALEHHVALKNVMQEAMNCYANSHGRSTPQEHEAPRKKAAGKIPF